MPGPIAIGTNSLRPGHAVVSEKTRAVARGVGNSDLARGGEHRYRAHRPVPSGATLYVSVNAKTTNGVDWNRRTKG